MRRYLCRICDGNRTIRLDADNRGQFIELLMRECEANGAALMFVSHDLSLAEYFDRSLDIDDINRVEAIAS